MLDLLWLLRAAPHILVVLWLNARGRLFVFRRRPDWFVSDVAELLPPDYQLDDDDHLVQGLVEQAQIEKDLRLRRSQKGAHPWN